MTLKQKFEKWKRDNYVTNGDLAIYAIYGFVLTGSTVLIIWAAKTQSKQIEQALREHERVANWANAELADGRQIFFFGDEMLSVKDAKYFV